MILDRTSARDVTPGDVRDLIERHVPEENALEYKAVADADLLKAACAIANSGGGFILIGMLEDDIHAASAIQHIENCRSVVDSVRQRLRDGITPRPVFEVVQLTVDAYDMIVVRISPQNPPHMVSVDKRTDFYKRYDATSERMRYDEIEQAFREKHAVDELAISPTPTAIIQTTLGRTEVSTGAEGFLSSTREKILKSETPSIAIIAASDGNKGAISAKDAREALQEPLYYRKAGWLVAHREFEVISRGGTWEQQFGPVSLTTITPSGDLVFVKTVDDVLCWRQATKEMMASPRIYPNALIEYCVTFAYLLADLAASSKPRRLVIQPMIANEGSIRLPLGEGGSVWFDQQQSAARTLSDLPVYGLPIMRQVETGHPILCRNLGFEIAAQFYALFGYNEQQVAFASQNEVIVESDADTATLTSLRAYLRDTLMKPITTPRPDFGTGSFMFGIEHESRRQIFWASEDFVEDHHWPEERLFALFDSLKIPETLRAADPKDRIGITNDGLKRFVKDR